MSLLFNRKLKKLVTYISPIILIFQKIKPIMSNLPVWASKTEKGIKKKSGRILKYVKTVFKRENRIIFVFKRGVNSKALMFNTGSY